MGERLAVRSSACDEDGVQHSFAGQLASFLNVAPEDAAARVRDVWRSAFDERALRYRRERGLPGSPRPPAVILQRMVEARVAGVAFSADPVSGRRGVAVVSAVRGLGAALVSGEVDAHTWHVCRDGTILERHISKTSRKIDGPVLTDEQVQEVAALAATAERLFGCPQDIEWAIGDRLDAPSVAADYLAALGPWIRTRLPSSGTTATSSKVTAVSPRHSRFRLRVRSIRRSIASSAG